MAAEERPQVRFEELPVSPEAKAAMREGFGYEFLTEVQAKTFEPILQGEDLVVKAKTGAGKTLSFLLPSIERVKRLEEASPAGSIDILVVSPVRELSMQISQEAEKLLKFHSGIRVACMVGGVPWEEDVAALSAAGADAICLVATPGRLQSHIAKTGGFADRLTSVQTLVLDEVDQLASEVFRPATLDIIRALPPQSSRQSLFYSATMSEEVTKLIEQTGKPNHSFIDVLQATDISVPDQIDQSYTVVQTEDMTRALWQCIQAAKVSDNGEPKVVVIFMTGRIAAYYADAFRKSGSGLDIFEIHARRSQKQRTDESDRFRAAQQGILFTSDVSSRGLDYPGVTEVIQMGAPHSKAEYIHRLGRTGRGGNSGRGHLLLHEFERGFLGELQDLPLSEKSFEDNAQGGEAMPDFVSMDIAKNVKAQAYYSRINHVMRNAGELTPLEILREAKRFASSIGALDGEGRPPEITEQNAAKMGVADIVDPALYIVPNPSK